MTADRNKQRRRTLVALLAVAAGMFGFAFALVPLYETFCEWTGLNGRTASEARETAPASPATDREVTIQFLAQVANGLPWEFRPTDRELRVRTGAINATQFYARNRAAVSITGQAVPSVAPGIAAPHLVKLECFCFAQQHLEAGAEVFMPVRFYVSVDLPKQVRTLTLSYTMFPVAETAVDSSAFQRGRSDRSGAMP